MKKCLVKNPDQEEDMYTDGLNRRFFGGTLMLVVAGFFAITNMMPTGMLELPEGVEPSRLNAYLTSTGSLALIFLVALIVWAWGINPRQRAPEEDEGRDGVKVSDRNAADIADLFLHPEEVGGTLFTRPTKPT